MQTLTKWQRSGIRTGLVEDLEKMVRKTSKSDLDHPVQSNSSKRARHKRIDKNGIANHNFNNITFLVLVIKVMRHRSSSIIISVGPLRVLIMSNDSHRVRICQPLMERDAHHQYS